MYKLVGFSFLILLAFSSVRCGSGEAPEKNTLEEPEEDLYEFQKFSFAEYDLPATIMLPDETANIGASTRPEVKHPEDGFKWEVEVGPNFQLIVEDWGDNRDMVSVKKKKLADLPMFKIRYLVDEPDFIVYESTLKVDGEKNASKSVGLEHISYHVYGQKIIDGYTYVFSSREEGNSKKIIDLMAKSIRSVKEIRRNS